MAFAIHPGNRYSLADLEAMPEDDSRYELLGGAIVMTPSPVPAHQRVSRQLEALLGSACPDGYELFHAPIDLDLADDQRAVPDLVIVHAAQVGERRLTTPALLVVEIVSPGSRLLDYRVKVAAYAESHVEHYWIVDPNADRVLAYRLDDDEYEVVRDQVGGPVSLTEPVAVRFTLADLLRP